MLRFFIAALVLAAAPAGAQTNSDISAYIAENGLAATAERLADPATPSDRLALGGVLFLRAIEKTLQTRWRYGMDATGSFLPVLRLPVPANPDPAPFDPETVGNLFATLITDLDAARVPVAAIRDDDDAGLILVLDDLWFDVDMDGTRGPREGVWQITSSTVAGRLPPGRAVPTIRFDTADAAWLAAYTHFLSAFGELVLAFDPGPQIARVHEARRAWNDLGAGTNYGNAYDMQFGTDVDMAAIVYFSLQQQPIAARTRAAREHLLSMIRQNRVFWARVEAETDDFAEWIPNVTQRSALGVEIPPEAGARWQQVLTDAEDLLEGRKLIPFWRLRTGAGINLKRLLEEPVPVDIAEWVHGVGLLPFAEEGERIGPENWWLFQQMARGNAMLFVVWFN